MQTQALCPALPCRRGPGSGHPGRQPLQTGPPRLSLFTQHTGRLPCEQRGGECQGEGGSPLGPPFPAGACCGGPTPLRAGPRPGGKQHSLSFPARTAPWNPIAHSAAQGLLGPVQKGPAAHLSLTSHRHQPAGRAHGDLSSRLWRGQACGTPVGRGPAPLSHDSADRPHREPRSPSPETLLVKPSLESFSLQARCGCHTCRPWSVHSATVTQITRHP